MQQIHNILLHGWLEVGHLGSLQNQGHVDVADPVPVPLHDGVRVLHEFRRIATLPSRIGVLKDLTDIGQRQGAKDGVHHRMINHVAVGMGDHPQLRFVYSTRFDVLSVLVRPL